MHTWKTVSGDFIDVVNVFTELEKYHGDLMSRNLLQAILYRTACIMQGGKDATSWADFKLIKNVCIQASIILCTKAGGRTE